jgi:hypothetical protein
LDFGKAQSHSIVAESNNPSDLNQATKAYLRQPTNRAAPAGTALTSSTMKKSNKTSAERAPGNAIQRKLKGQHGLTAGNKKAVTASNRLHPKPTHPGEQQPEKPQTSCGAVGCSHGSSVYIAVRSSMRTYF